MYRPDSNLFYRLQNKDVALRAANRALELSNAVVYPSKTILTSRDLTVDLPKVSQMAINYLVKEYDYNVMFYEDME